jgi:hypothetical protein
MKKKDFKLNIQKDSEFPDFPEDPNTINDPDPFTRNFNKVKGTSGKPHKDELTLEDKMILLKILKSKKYELLNKIGISRIVAEKRKVSLDLKAISTLKREIRSLKKENYFPEKLIQFFLILLILTISYQVLLSLKGLIDLNRK